MNTLAVVGMDRIRGMLFDKPQDVSMENNEEIISRLKFLGYIEKGEKIDVRHINRQPDSLITKVSRTILYKDNRINTRNFVKNVIHRTFEILELMTLKSDHSVVKSILNDLLSAKKGILNLKSTYGDDTKFCCDMDVILEQIDTKISLYEPKKDEEEQL